VAAFETNKKAPQKIRLSVKDMVIPYFKVWLRTALGSRDQRPAPLARLKVVLLHIQLLVI